MPIKGYTVVTTEYRYIEWRLFRENQIGCTNGVKMFDPLTTRTLWEIDPIQEELYLVDENPFYKASVDNKASDPAYGNITLPPLTIPTFSPTSKSPTSNSPTSKPPTSNSKSDNNTIITAVVASCIVVIVFSLLLLFLRRRRKKYRQKENNTISSKIPYRIISDFIK
jgi:hypothetical protein